MRMMYAHDECARPMRTTCMRDPMRAADQSRLPRTSLGYGAHPSCARTVLRLTLASPGTDDRGHGRKLKQGGFMYKGSCHCGHIAFEVEGVRCLEAVELTELKPVPVDGRNR